MNIFKKIVKKIFSSQNTSSVHISNIKGSSITINNITTSTDINGESSTLNDKFLPSNVFNLKLKKINSFENDTPFMINLLENDSVSKNTVTYSIPDQFKDNIVFENKNNKLIIKTKGNIVGNFTTSFNIYTTLSNIKQILNNSVGKIIVNGTLSQKDLDISLQSVGNIAIENITCDTLTVTNNGNGRILFVKGKSKHTQFNITSIGDINAEELISENILVNSDGIGQLYAFVNNEAKGKLTSIGNVNIYGKPNKVLIESDGIGSLKIN